MMDKTMMTVCADAAEDYAYAIGKLILKNEENPDPDFPFVLACLRAIYHEMIFFGWQKPRGD